MEHESDLTRAIKAIVDLDRTGCLSRWRQAFACPPPKHLSITFMQRVHVWDKQCKTLGAVSAKTERRLKLIASGKTMPPPAKPGSHLVTEWNGRTYQVDGVNGGYVMDGKSWRSLSAIARHITGAPVKDLVLQQLGKPDAIPSLTKGLSAVAIAAATKQLRSIQQLQDLLGIIKRVDLRPGSLKVLLDEQALAAILELQIDQLDPDAMLIEAPFLMRRRGVELRLHLGEAPKEVDRTLVQNIVKARCWLALITEGKPIAEIAKVEGLSNRRIQDLLPLAFLAPDLIETISIGEQPIGLNTEYSIKTGFPTVWSEQRAQFAAL